VDGQERLDEGFALGEAGAELSAALGARLDDVLEADATVGQFLADGVAEKLAVVVDGLVAVTEQ